MTLTSDKLCQREKKIVNHLISFFDVEIRILLLLFNFNEKKKDQLTEDLTEDSIPIIKLYLEIFSFVLSVLFPSKFMVVTNFHTMRFTTVDNPCECFFFFFENWFSTYLSLCMLYANIYSERRRKKNLMHSFFCTVYNKNIENHLTKENQITHTHSIYLSILFDVVIFFLYNSQMSH